MLDVSNTFTHHKLDVYRLALQMAKQAKQLSDRVPRGYRSFADHMLRAAGQTVLLIGEGANRYTAGQKRQRYSEARGGPWHSPGLTNAARRPSPPSSSPPWGCSPSRMSSRCLHPQGGSPPC